MTEQEQDFEAKQQSWHLALESANHTCDRLREDNKYLRKALNYIIELDPDGGFTCCQYDMWTLARDALAGTADP